MLKSSGADPELFLFACETKIRTENKSVVNHGKIFVTPIHTLFIQSTDTKAFYHQHSVIHKVNLNSVAPTVVNNSRRRLQRCSSLHIKLSLTMSGNETKFLKRYPARIILKLVVLPRKKESYIFVHSWLRRKRESKI
jgi:hypothetical protein